MPRRRRQIAYGALYFGVLLLLLAVTVLILVVADWPWALVPAALAVAWVSPLTQRLVDRSSGD